MKSLFTFMRSGALAILKAPFRGSRAPQPPAQMDAATYAAMVAEAERIASPYRRHIAHQQSLGSNEPGGEFPEVEALLDRAGIGV
ncbi:hypothetical protein [Kouleothrix sp.]|uniref:hypothetical protein n=1 Tax=Kouleothrix sp. TaxID=2779161 RepID=UPI00391D16B8